MQVVDIAAWVASRRPALQKIASERDLAMQEAARRRTLQCDMKRRTNLPEAADPIARRHRPEL